VTSSSRAGSPTWKSGRLSVNGTESGWERRIDDGSTVELWARHPRSDPEPDPRFLLDVRLGKVARLLRLLGFDTSYAAEADDAALADDAVDQDRVLLTRSRGHAELTALPGSPIVRTDFGWGGPGIHLVTSDSGQITWSVAIVNTKTSGGPMSRSKPVKVGQDRRTDDRYEHQPESHEHPVARDRLTMRSRDVRSLKPQAVDRRRMSYGYRTAPRSGG
jgi:hypothetical protein